MTEGNESKEEREMERGRNDRRVKIARGGIELTRRKATDGRRRDLAGEKEVGRSEHSPMSSPGSYSVAQH